MSTKIKTYTQFRHTALSHLDQTLKLYHQSKLNPELIPLFRAYRNEINSFYQYFQHHHNELIKLLPEYANYEDLDKILIQADTYYFQIKSTLAKLEDAEAIQNPPQRKATSTSWNHR